MRPRTPTCVSMAVTGISDVPTHSTSSPSAPVGGDGMTHPFSQSRLRQMAPLADGVKRAIRLVARTQSLALDGVVNNEHAALEVTGQRGVFHPGHVAFRGRPLEALHIDTLHLHAFAAALRRIRLEGNLA